MIRISELVEEGVKLPFHPLVFGIGVFGLMSLAVFVITRLNADR